MFDQSHLNLQKLCNDQVVVVNKDSNLQFHIALANERNSIINVINRVAGEHKYLQTDRYYPSPVWENLLDEGINTNDGLLLLAIESPKGIIGFARVYPDSNHPLERNAGNIGIALLPAYRSRGFGAIILKYLMGYAIALDYRILTANILETNMRSRNLFSSCGFKAVKKKQQLLGFLDAYVNELYYETESIVFGETERS